MIVNRINDWAARQPDKAAIICNDEPVSYAAFAGAIDAARRHLASHDLPVGQTAVVLGAGMPLCWFITLALRCLGLNTIVVQSFAVAADLGLKSVAAIVATAQAAAAYKITSPGLPGLRVIIIPEEVWDAPRSGTPAPIDDSDRPYGGHILYTSGTTGTYKKVLMEGRHECAQAARCVVHRLIEPNSVVHNLSMGLWTGIGYKQPLAVWTMGATLVAESRPGGLRNFFRHRPTFVSMPPGFVPELLAETAAIPRPNRMPIVSLGGGFVSRQLIDTLHKANFDQVMINYSSTECSHILRSHVEDMDGVSWLSPAGDRQVEIVDIDDRPCAVGEEGMLRVALLDHDSHGYLDDPMTSARVFRDGWFYPGDLAVSRGDGRIRILGRVDDVLNLAGQKVPIQLFEDWARKALGVESLCVFNHQDDSGNEMLAVVIEGSHLPERVRLQALAKRVKQVPQVRFSLVNSFPRGANGMMKINRRKVLELVRASWASQSDSDSARP